MYVCSCRGVTERVISEVIARGARTVDHIATGCEAGGRCGGCRPMLERLLVAHLGQPQPS